MRETPKELEGSGPEKKQSATRRILFIATLILAGSMGASLLIYFGGTRDAFTRSAQESHTANGDPRPTFLDQMDRVVLKAVLVTTAGWVCFLGSLLAGGIVWRRSWRRRFEMVEEKNKEW